jgi:site-specific DNA recombinase
LTGKISCGVCGGSYVGNSRSRREVRQYTYICNNKKRTKECCNPEIRKEPLEKYIIDDIRNTFLNIDFEELATRLEAYLKSKYSNVEGELEHIKQEISNVNQKMARLYEAVENGLSNKETYNRINELLKQKEDLEVTLAVTSNAANKLWDKHRIIEYMKKKKEALSSSDTASCKELINLFVDRVILTPDDILIEYRFGVDNAGGPEGHLTLSTQISRVKLYEKYYGNNIKKPRLSRGCILNGYIPEINLENIFRQALEN